MTPSERGRANRARGVGFERRIAKKFREAGFECRRLWQEQFDHKCCRDLEVSIVLRPFTSGHPEVRYVLPVALQLKCTKDPADLDRGFREVITEPGFKLYACIHSCNRQLRIMTGEPREGYMHMDLISWEIFLSRLRLLCPLKSPSGLTPKSVS